MSDRPSLPETFRKLADLLGAQRVPFVVVGGLAAAIQGEPRVTLDVDVMVTLESPDVPALAAAAQADGWDIEPETAVMQWRFSGFVRLFFGPRGHQVAADLMANASAYLHEVSWRAQAIRMFDRVVPVATAEDVIVLKCSAWREKDIPDLRGILSRHDGKLDLEYIRKWVAWFAKTNDHFAEMPRRFEALLSGAELPPPAPE